MSQQAITVGESFQVQYVLDDIEKDNEFTAPAFRGFRIVSGPYTYTGSINGDKGPGSLKNIVFTLVSMRPGRYIIPGATARVNGKLIKCDNLVIGVITKKEAKERATKKQKKENASEYFLQPGEDPYEKMGKNLFMKVQVDKTSCYVGQPVLATFKLYSRLESKSDIVKNPGFYGFTVQDVVNLNDHISATETVSGKPFDVHTIRIVQLYPLQAGLFTIDPMEVVNKVEFSKSIVNKKTEQEIAEGVYEKSDLPAGRNTVTVENHISTEKIAIKVRPYPEAKKPPAFNGATGNFLIRSSLEKASLARNEEGGLIVTISGKGNFTQLSSPAIQWPKDIEGFDPVMKDSLDKIRVPLKGSRTFRFPFIAMRAGAYSIPAVSLTFFDPDSNNYKTVSTDPAEMNISDEEIKALQKKPSAPAAPNTEDRSTIWLYGSIFLVVIVIILFQLRETKEEAANEQEIEKTASAVSTEQILMPVQFSLIADDGMFYILLQKTIWDHVSTQLKLSASRMNKDELYKALKENHQEGLYGEILAILQECEAAVFTKAEIVQDRQELLNRAKVVLDQVNV